MTTSPSLLRKVAPLLLAGAAMAPAHAQLAPPAPAVPGTPANSPAALAAIDPKTIKKNPRVTNLVENGVLLAEARPGKLFYFTGEAVTGNVTLSNGTPETKTVTVRAWLEQGLGQTAALQTREVILAASSAQQLAFAFAPELIKTYGQSFLVEITADGKTIATGGDVFNTADNVWRTGIAGMSPLAFTAEHVQNMAGIESTIERFRDNYVNTIEKFFWAPDDFANMTPTTPQWYSGQARYHENMERFKHLMDYGHQVGVLPITYGKSIGSGSAARDFIREYPESVFGYGGTMSFVPDTEELAKWDVETKHWSSTAWADYNMNDPAVVQHGIDQIIASTKQFGWAGVRFDGHFQARTGKQRVGSKVVEFGPDDADRQTAANQKALKVQATKASPGFVFGYNFANCGLDPRLQSNLRETIELCEGGGHIMDEYAKKIDGGDHPYRKWADYAALIVRETEQTRRLGGELFPMTDGGQVGHFQTIFTLAASGHPNNLYGPRAYHHFATRYGELLWSPGVRNLWNPLGMVVVRPGVMWENFVREQVIDERHKRLIVHLINPPAQETATETARLEKELQRREQRRWAIKAEADKQKKTPDFSELDALPPIQLEPAPQKDIPVRVVPRALEGNRDGSWNATGALLLNADDGSRNVLSVDKSDPYFWQVTVPALKYWSVVVIELEKK